MTTPLSHDDAFAMLPELALGLLSPEDETRVMEVVATSPACQAELASLRGAAGALGDAAPAAPMPDARRRAMRERLLARAAASTVSDATGSSDADASNNSGAAPVAAPASPSLRLEKSGAGMQAKQAPILSPRRDTVSRFVPWFAAAASIGIALAQARTTGVRTEERDAARAALTAATASSTQLASQLASRESLVASMTGAQVRVVEMVSTAQLAPGARMFWDRLSNRWTLITHDLQPVQSGRTYQLWLVTARAEKISAGTFNTDAQGRAVVQATYALAEQDLAAIAITEEPEGGSPQPTGAILVAGAPTR